MIAQALVIQGSNVLMVKQYVQRGDIVGNFPGGGVEADETPEQACIREVKEETGYDVRITNLLHDKDGKYTYIAEIIGGQLHLDKDHTANQDIMEIAWISLYDDGKFDCVTAPILHLYLSGVDGTGKPS